MVVPGGAPQPVPHLCLRVGADDEHGASLVGQGTTEYDKAFFDVAIGSDNVEHTPQLHEGVSVVRNAGHRLPPTYNALRDCTDREQSP